MYGKPLRMVDEACTPGALNPRSHVQAGRQIAASACADDALLRAAGACGGRTCLAPPRPFLQRGLGRKSLPQTSRRAALQLQAV